MAVIAKSTPSTQGSAKPVSSTPPRPKLVLPTEISKPSDELGDYTWLLYGERKIGKTSLAAQFPETLFLMCEPGGKGLSIYQMPVASWGQFIEIITLLKETDQFKTVVIDTVDILYDLCMSAVCKNEGITHPADANDYGKTWKKVSDTFENALRALIRTNRGVMFLSHAEPGEYTSASGKKYTKLVPTMPKQARKFVIGFVDIIAYYGYFRDERLLTIRGSDSVDAGHRVDGRFLVTNKEDGSSERLYNIPMGNSPAEGYRNIHRAFNNEQDDIRKVDIDAALSESPAKRGK